MELDRGSLLSWKGLKRAGSFTWEKCAEQTAEVYRKVFVEK